MIFYSLIIHYSRRPVAKASFNRGLDAIYQEGGGVL